MTNQKIEKIIKLEKKIRKLKQEHYNAFYINEAGEIMEKIIVLEDEQQDLINELSNKELDLLNERLNQKPQKKFIVKIYKKDTWIDNGIKNENWRLYKLFRTNTKQEAENIKNHWLKNNNENDYKIEIKETIKE